MYEPSINYIAVLVSAVIFFIIGGLWYSPMLFAKPWMNAIGFSDEQLKKMKEKGPGAKPFIISSITVINWLDFSLWGQFSPFGYK
ncbi:MAG: DUF1761 domain-containing protein [Candidatus Marinimicrobia bacterium]|nr:DUF1761 domain-containing protein [Candidatus Neomarinimicrobiota bacterium]